MCLSTEGFVIAHVSSETGNNARLLRPPGFDFEVDKNSTQTPGVYVQRLGEGASFVRLLIEGFAIVHVSRKTRNNARLLRPPGFDCGVAKVGPKPRGSKFRGLIAGLRRFGPNPGVYVCGKNGRNRTRTCDLFCVREAL